MLAVCPGHVLDRDAARRARDASHHVQKEHAQAPQRHELESARRQAIIDAAALATARALWPVAAMWRDRDRDRQAADLLFELHHAVDKSALLLNPIEDSLDLHPAVRLREMVGRQAPPFSPSRRGMRHDERVEAARPMDAQNASTGLCKTADGFAQLPPAFPLFLVHARPKRTPPVSVVSSHRFCGGG